MAFRGKSKKLKTNMICMSKIMGWTCKKENCESFWCCPVKRFQEVAEKKCLDKLMNQSCSGEDCLSFNNCPDKSYRKKV